LFRFVIQKEGRHIFENKKVEGEGYMNETVVVVSIVSLIVIILLVGIPVRLTRLVGEGIARVVIGALFIFLINIAGDVAGIHLPINLFTVTVTGFLGIPGIVALIFIQQYVIS
jgi:inhibitor of the pro-sigma K processing machinery